MKTFILLLLVLLLAGCTEIHGVSLDDTNIAQMMCNRFNFLDTVTAYDDINGKFLKITCRDGTKIMYRPPPTKGRF